MVMWKRLRTQNPKSLIWVSNRGRLTVEFRVVLENWLVGPEWKHEWNAFSWLGTWQIIPHQRLNEIANFMESFACEIQLPGLSYHIDIGCITSRVFYFSCNFIPVGMQRRVWKWATDSYIHWSTARRNSRWLFWYLTDLKRSPSPPSPPSNGD
jgi:hypothetical protein